MIDDGIPTQILDTKQKIFSAPPDENMTGELDSNAEQMGNTLEEKSEVIGSDYLVTVRITICRI